MKLFVDDVRPAPDDWFLVTEIEPAITLLEAGIVTDLSLDHDLGEDKQTGYDLMNWIEEQVHTNEYFKLPEISFHTSNPAGRKNMVAAYKSILKWVKKNETNR